MSESHIFQNTNKTLTNMPCRDDKDDYLSLVNMNSGGSRVSPVSDVSSYSDERQLLFGTPKDKPCMPTSVAI